MSTTQPIALPNSHSSFQDYSMAEGSYTGSSGSFNPASYARHFLGSPISWRQGSFGSRFPSNSPSTNFLNSLDEFKHHKMSSSIDSDRGSILNALNVSDREGEFCRNYTCCGLHLNDMHALVEHLEEAHFGAYNPDAVNQMQMSYNNQSIHPDHPMSPTTQVSNQAPPHVGSSCAGTHTYPASFDPDDMELELDLETSSVPQLHHQPPTAHSSPSSGVPTPPDTPITTPLSVYPANALPNSHLVPGLQVHSQPASPMPYDGSAHVSAVPTAASTRHSSPSGTSTRPNLNLNLSAFQRSAQFGSGSPSVLSNPEEAFNSYARYAGDYSACMLGTQYSSAEVNDGQANWQQQQASNTGQCVPPALLFSSSANTTPLSTPDGSRVPSPSGGLSAPATPCRATPPSSIASGRSSSRTSSAASTTLSRPASSLLLSKPFRCPKPNCNKSYKQANGLKYHMTHGSCNFAPPKDLEHVKDLLERKRRDREKLTKSEESISAGLGRSQSLRSVSEADDAEIDSLSSIMSNITESELREVEKEAEKRMKPFACGVGDCQRRYKNMNGLRYHYQHSGDHGAVGLALLASGQHECLQGQKRNQHPSPHSDEKELKRRTSAHTVGGSTGRGSASMPVSRASSRTGTPQPLTPSQLPGSHYSPNTNSTVTGINTMGITHAQPFTPPQAGSQQTMSPPPHQAQAQTHQQQQLAATYQQQYAQLQRQQQHYQQQYAQQAQAQAQQQLMQAAMYGSAVDLS